jgi:uncharacterized protein
MKKINRQNQIIKATENFVRKTLEDNPAHDWWHTFRVWKMTIEIGKKERADLFIVEMAALLHDVEDWKLNKNKNPNGRVNNWLIGCEIDDLIVDKINIVIERVSFKGSAVNSIADSIETKVVQDADRLDAMGAIGITRVFTYGGEKSRAIYNPEKPLKNLVQDLRISDSYSSIHHFYDKLLLLKDLMNTKAAKKIAAVRHTYMLLFLKRFLSEWKDTE